MRSVIGILVVALIAAAAYRMFLQKAVPEGAATPAQTISVVGVKNDLLAIAQAERSYQAEHGKYAALDELVASGALAMAKTGRDGYNYEVESSDSTFRVVAQCPTSSTPSCVSYMIDPHMEVQPVP